MDQYINLGACIDNDSICIGKTPSHTLDLFWAEDYIAAFIKKINVEPCGYKFDEYAVYNRHLVDYDVMEIYSLEAWKAIYENNILTHHGFYGCPVINWLIEQDRDISTDVLDYVKKKFKENVRMLMYCVKTLNNAKWLYENGAVLDPEDYLEDKDVPLKDWWKNHTDPKFNEMYNYFFQ